MSHTMPWGKDNPGCVIFLLDQSGSMSDTFGGTSLARGQQLKDQVATILNNTINKMGKESRKGDIISPRVEIAVIGYGPTKGTSVLAGNLAGRDLVPIDELMNNPAEVEERDDEKYNPGTGEVKKVKVKFPIWVQPTAGGGTPMCAALQKATELARAWVSQHPHCFPPILINITDGACTDGDPRPIAKEFMQLRTDDGEALVFNCHITATSIAEIKYPGPSDPLPADHYAPILFEISSEIPESMRTMAAEMGVKNPMNPGDRGFVFNADISSVAKMIVFATVPAKKPETGGGGDNSMPEADPNR